MKLICLLDCNNFFVSCERLFRPDLLRKPTVVASSNDGCAVARSQEAKTLGIPMGVPLFQVRDIVKENNVAIFSSNFKLYRDISSRVMTVLKREVGHIEQYSIDEAFFEIETTDEKQARQFLASIKQTIEREIGVPVSLGAGKTMTIAKYASEKEKRKSGVAVLFGKVWHEEKEQVPINSIWGVGKETSFKMSKLGIKTVSDFLRQERSIVDKLFGLHGLRLYDELREIAVHKPSLHKEAQKSIMSTRSFSKKTTNKTELQNALSYHTANACQELRESVLRARGLRVILGTDRYGDFALQGSVSEVFLPEATSDTRIFLREVTKVLNNSYKPNVPYKKTGIVLFGIESGKNQQLDLFQSEESRDKSEKLMQAIDSINGRLGRNSVTIGRLKSADPHPKSDFISPSYTTSWSQIANVRA